MDVTDCRKVTYSSQKGEKILVGDRSKGYRRCRINIRGSVEKMTSHSRLYLRSNSPSDVVLISFWSLCISERNCIIWCHSKILTDVARCSFDLPPSARATPLSVLKPQTRIEVLDNTVDTEKRANKRRKPDSVENGGKTKSADDTPKQFARLMAWSKEGRALRKGLDDGEMGRKERRKKDKTAAAKHGKTDTEDASGAGGAAKAAVGSFDSAHKGGPKAATKVTKPPKPAKDMSLRSPPRQQDHGNSAPVAVDERTKLKIKPGERLQDFALRVDQTLPLSGVPKHSTKETLRIPGLKSNQNLTKHNKKLLRLQSQWREEEKRRREKGEEREDEMEDQKEEDGLLWTSVHDQQSSKKGKRMKRGGVDEGDIWKVLEKKNEGQGKALTAGQMVQQPPKLGKLKNMFKDPGDRRAVGAV